MSKYKYTESEKRYNSILKYQRTQLEEMEQILEEKESKEKECIKRSEEILKELGYVLPKISPMKSKEFEQKDRSKTISIQSFDELYIESKKYIKEEVVLEKLFTEKELRENEEYINLLQNEYNQIYKLDTTDWAISVFAGIISGLIETLLVGIPKKTLQGIEAGELSNSIRKFFSEKIPEEKVSRLEKMSKVPYDAPYNKDFTNIEVEGLNTYFHRLLSLGHDPFLGFFTGTLDILRGTMTTIDKNGKFVCQVMVNHGYSDRREENIFLALSKQLGHLLSDINTSMGLPVPFMGLFNFLQFGSIGKEKLTIAEIVQGMYYEGYDFIHFCSMSIPVMVTEIIIRIGYAVKRISEGNSVRESIPFSLNREKAPKLSTMLFAGHSLATVINLGKIFYTANPLAINYPQWLVFIKYSYSQLKWNCIMKPELRHKYVIGEINKGLAEVYSDIDDTFSELLNTL